MTETLRTEKNIRQKERSSIVDQAVGNRLKLRRNIVGISQDELAKSIGVSFQQVQKYEKGTNRISASRLFQISQVLNVPVDFFFDDINQNSTKSKKTNYTNSLTKIAITKSESVELVKNFWELPPIARKNFISLLKVMIKNYD